MEDLDDLLNDDEPMGGSPRGDFDPDDLSLLVDEDEGDEGEEAPPRAPLPLRERVAGGSAKGGSAKGGSARGGSAKERAADQRAEQLAQTQREGETMPRKAPVRTAETEMVREAREATRGALDNVGTLTVRVLQDNPDNPRSGPIHVHTFERLVPDDLHRIEDLIVKQIGRPDFHTPVILEMLIARDDGKLEGRPQTKRITIPGTHGEPPSASRAGWPGAPGARPPIPGAPGPSGWYAPTPSPVAHLWGAPGAVPAAGGDQGLTMLLASKLLKDPKPSGDSPEAKALQKELDRARQEAAEAKHQAELERLRAENANALKSLEAKLERLADKPVDTGKSAVAEALAGLTALASTLIPAMLNRSTEEAKARAAEAQATNQRFETMLREMRESDRQNLQTLMSVLNKEDKSAEAMGKFFQVSMDLQSNNAKTTAHILQMYAEAVGAGRGTWWQEILSDGTQKLLDVLGQFTEGRAGDPPGDEGQDDEGDPAEQIAQGQQRPALAAPKGDGGSAGADEDGDEGPSGIAALIGKHQLVDVIVASIQERNPDTAASAIVNLMAEIESQQDKHPFAELLVPYAHATLSDYPGTCGQIIREVARAIGVAADNFARNVEGVIRNALASQASQPAPQAQAPAQERAKVRRARKE